MMAGETPGFWWRAPGWQTRMLSPVSSAYAHLARRRLDHGVRAEAGMPVLCVGNFTVGGGGKTPTALALAASARAAGLKPGFLSRGHGGSLRQPTLVDPVRHGAGATGDEPMLLARAAPTAVSRDRGAGAALLQGAGCDFLIMDDGFQSARLTVDLALLVVDSGRGIGNGCVVPAGPLRADITDQMRHADALLVVGRGSASDGTIRRAARAGKPIHEAHLVPRLFERPDRPILGFAGIADPEKFYRTLREMELQIGETRDFPDHHRFSEEEAGELLDEAARKGFALATTEKDAVRLLNGGDRQRALLEKSLIVAIDLVFDPPGLGTRLVEETVRAFKRRTRGA